MMRMLSSSIPHHHGNEKLLSHQASSTGQSYAPQPFFLEQRVAIQRIILHDGAYAVFLCQQVQQVVAVFSVFASVVVHDVLVDDIAPSLNDARESDLRHILGAIRGSCGPVR